MENLNLSDDDNEVLTFQSNPNQQRKADPSLCLVGRFLTQKQIRTHMLKERMATVWQPGRGLAIREVAPGIFLFQFFCRLDIEAVVKGGPWQFDGHLLVLSIVGAGDVSAQVPLFHAAFWVQVHDLPIGLMSEEVEKGLGDYIGEFLEYDAKNSSDFWKSYMRILVKLEVRKPLRQGKKIRRDDGDIKVVRFKYERLTMFCFLCGLLGHDDSHYEKRFLMEEDDRVRLWGPELRVERRRPGGTGACRWLRDDGDGNETQGFHGRRGDRENHAMPTQDFGSDHRSNSNFAFNAEPLILHGTSKTRGRGCGVSMGRGKGIVITNNSHRNVHSSTVADLMVSHPTNLSFIGQPNINGKSMVPLTPLTRVDGEDAAMDLEESLERKRKRQLTIRGNKKGSADGSTLVTQEGLEVSGGDVTIHFLSASAGSQHCREP